VVLGELMLYGIGEHILFFVIFLIGVLMVEYQKNECFTLNGIFG
jgi:hypothetical protein